MKEFQFQAAYEPTFAAPVVNVRTRINCYNFLAPFTNNLAASNIVYWRVYYVGTNGLTNAFGSPRSFVISPTPTYWDRSYLGDADYWSTHARHPRIMFNAENRPALSNWLTTNLSAQVKPHWQQQKLWAYQSITQSWWTLPDPTSRGPLGSSGQHPATWGQSVYRAAFVWQMTRDPRFLTEPANLCQRASDMAVYVTTNGFEYFDQITLQTGDLLKSVFFCYDWLYDEFTASQRSNLLYVIERCAQFSLQGSGIFQEPIGPGAVEISATPFRQCTNGYRVELTAITKRGQNHAVAWMFNHAFGALAAYEDGPYSRELLERMLHLNISRPFQYGDDGHAGAGRGYNRDFIYGGDMLFWNIAASTVFPEVQLQKNPYWIQLAEWQQRMSPVGFWERHEPWGDLGAGGYLRTPSWASDTRDIAAFTGDGKARLYWENAVAYYGDSGAWQTVATLPLTFHYPLPIAQTNSETAKVFPNGGWVMGSTYEPNTKRGFNAGAGFIIKGSPQGWLGQHDSPSDLDLQLWAYGAPVTESGYGYSPQSKIGWMRNVPAFNGLGLFNSQLPTMEFYSRIFAFTNAADFTYTAIDGTGSYPIRNYPSAGGQSMPGTYAEAHNRGQGRALTKMHRHLLFMRKKYFVLYDDMSALNNSTFSWIWQIPNPGVTISNQSFTYTTTNAETKSNITVVVAQVVNPASLTLHNLSGVNVFKNPVSGADYSPGTIYTGDGNLPSAQAQLQISLIYKGVGQSVVFTWTDDPASTNNHVIFKGANGAESLTNLLQALRDYPWSSFSSQWSSFAGFQINWLGANQFRAALAGEDLREITYYESTSAYSVISAATIAAVSPRPNAIWVQNAVPSQNFHFLTVIYPVAPGGSHPIITRLDDWTVSVSNGADQDVISFDADTSFPATLIVDVAAIRPPAAPGPIGFRPATPRRPFVNQ